MTRDIKEALWFSAFLLLMALACQIGCGQSTRQKTISSALVTTDTTCRGFKAYSLFHEKAIVTKDADEATAKADLAKWRSAADKVFDGCTGAYRAVAVAATLDDEQSLASLVAAAKIIVDELKELGVKIP